jgi:hypothetical protein
MINQLLRVVTIVALPFFQNHSFAQIPDLGLASSYAVFTSVGAFNNLGATSITGDIGTNVGAFTGFPPGNVNGVINVSNPISAQVSSDVQTAYDSLNTITCDSILGNSMGTGQLLSPNVYCIGAATALSGDLILDGLGNPNAIFVFKIDGALSSSAFSKIVLINAASSSNIYWQINGQIELGANSIFVGNALVNGAIILLNEASIEGRVLAIQGAISLFNNIVIIPSFILPISLVSFQGEQCPTDNCVNLSWQTAFEINVDYFMIEKSVDGINFRNIGKQGATGNSVSLLSYIFTDQNPTAGSSYYRLNQFSFDNLREHSNIIAVSFVTIILNAAVYPNPFKSSIEFFASEASLSGNCKLIIFGSRGREVIKIAIKKQITNIETISLPSGTYMYHLYSNDTKIQTGKLVSNN